MFWPGGSTFTGFLHGFQIGFAGPWFFLVFDHFRSFFGEGNQSVGHQRLPEVSSPKLRRFERWMLRQRGLFERKSKSQGLERLAVLVGVFGLFAFVVVKETK